MSCVTVTVTVYLFHSFPGRCHRFATGFRSRPGDFRRRSTGELLRPCLLDGFVRSDQPPEPQMGQRQVGYDKGMTHGMTCVTRVFCF